jgi:FAD/FMN-containing dehydrogenase
MSALHASHIESFRKAFGGEVLLPSDTGYEEARRVWNGMVDRKPALIARCTSVDDVVRAVAFARERGLLVAVRGGGHNIAGSGVCDDGLVIDLSPMQRVQVDVENRRAFVEPGCTLAEVDAATQAHGLATPLGINSTTGVAGLTLGGGFGWLSRKYGMTVDNLLSADVVISDGRQMHASASENADLFWGLRGGGGNFGIVVRFEFQLHPVGPEVLSGLIVFPFEQAKTVLARFARFTETMPEAFNVWLLARKAPPLPFLPVAVHGRDIVALALCHAGDPAEGNALVDELRGFGTACGEHVGVQPYVAWQRAFDALLTPGARNYWKTHNFSRLDDAALDVIIDHAGRLPSAQCEVFVATLGGRASRTSPEAMAYSNRDANYVMNAHGRWASEEDDGRCIAWARGLFAGLQPFAAPGAYVNFMTQDEADRVGPAYGTSYDRLLELKRKYDPTNFFRMNQNIKPA